MTFIFFKTFKTKSNILVVYTNIKNELLKTLSTCLLFTFITLFKQEFIFGYLWFMEFIRSCRISLYFSLKLVLRDAYLNFFLYSLDKFDQILLSNWTSQCLDVIEPGTFGLKHSIVAITVCVFFVILLWHVMSISKQLKHGTYRFHWQYLRNFSQV